MKQPNQVRQGIPPLVQAKFEQAALLASTLAHVCDANTERMTWPELVDLLHPLQLQIDALEVCCAFTSLAAPAERINRYLSRLLIVMEGNPAHTQPCALAVLLAPVLTECEAVELAQLRGLL